MPAGTNTELPPDLFSRCPWGISGLLAWLLWQPTSATQKPSGRMISPCIFPEVMPISKVALKQSVTSLTFILSSGSWTMDWSLTSYYPTLEENLHHVCFPVSFKPCKFQVRIEALWHHNNFSLWLSSIPMSELLLPLS